MLIGISGYKGSGKDTVADYLVEHYGFVKKSFSEPLKKACQALFLFTNEQLYVDKEKIDDYWQISPRTALQWLGTDAIRKNLDANFFVKHFDLWYRHNKGKPAFGPVDCSLPCGRSLGVGLEQFNVVISDLRFVNESNYIIEHQGLIIDIHRFDTTDDMHLSEQEHVHLYPNAVIHNDATIGDLYDNVDQCLSQFKIDKVEKKIIDICSNTSCSKLGENTCIKCKEPVCDEHYNSLHIWNERVCTVCNEYHCEDLFPRGDVCKYCT